MLFLEKGQFTTKIAPFDDMELCILNQIMKAPTKEFLIPALENSKPTKADMEEPELYPEIIKMLDDLIYKIKKIDGQDLIDVFPYFPVDPYTRTPDNLENTVFELMEDGFYDMIN